MKTIEMNFKIKVKEEDFMDITMQQVKKYELSASSDHSTSKILYLHEKWSFWIYSESSVKQLHRLIHMTAATYKKINDVTLLEIYHRSGLRLWNSYGYGT